MALKFSKGGGVTPPMDTYVPHIHVDNFPSIVKTERYIKVYWEKFTKIF
jgi:hypothetical protein